MTLTVIIPARNEEAGVGRTVLATRSALDRAGHPYRLILVDDGSTDGTGRILEELRRGDPDGRIEVIHHPSPRGLGAAYKSALERTGSGFVTWLPADGEIDPSGLALDRLRADAIVIPYPEGSVRARGLPRSLLSWVFQRSLNVFFFNRIRYFNGNALYPAEWARSVRVGSNGFFFNAELLLRILKSFHPEAEVIEVPFRLQPRSSGSSKALSLSNLADVFRSFVRLRVSL